MCIYLGSSVKPQTGKNRTFQWWRHFDKLQVKQELSAARKGAIGRTSSRHSGSIQT